MEISMDSKVCQKQDKMDAESYQEQENTDEDYFKISDNPQVPYGSKIIDFMEKAIERKSESEMKYLLEKAFECKTTRKQFHRESSSLLCRVIEMGAHTLIEQLVKSRARRQRLNSDGDTDITLAIKHKQLSVLKELLKFKQTINSTNMKGYFPLLLAAKEKYVEGFQLLIEAGANVNKKIGETFMELKKPNQPWCSKEHKSLKGNSVAHFLVCMLHLERMKRKTLILGPESLDDCIQMLLFILDSKKICKTATNFSGKTIFDELIFNQEESVNIFNKLHQKNFLITLEDSIPSACYLTPDASNVVLQAIHKKIPEPDFTEMVNVSKKSMLSPLSEACRAQNATAVEWLLKKGADPNCSTSKQLTSVLSETINFTGNRSAFPDSALQITPLHVAISGITPQLDMLQDIQDVIKLLIRNGAKVDAKLSTGTTPMGCMLKKMAFEDESYWEENMAEELRKIFFLFLQAGANPDICFQKASRTGTKLLIGEIKFKLFRPVLMMLLETSTYLRLKSGLTLAEANRQLSTISQFLPEGFTQRCVNEPKRLMLLCRCVILQKLDNRHLADPPKYLSMLPVRLQDYICLTYLHDQDWYDSQNWL